MGRQKERTAGVLATMPWRFGSGMVAAVPAMDRSSTASIARYGTPGAPFRRRRGSAGRGWWWQRRAVAIDLERLGLPYDR